MKFLGAVLVVFGAAAFVYAVHLLVDASRTAGLRADSLEAELDSTRTVAGSYIRRAVQAEAKATRLEDSLKLKPKVVIETKIELVPFEVEVQVPVEVDPVTMDRVAHFENVRQEPFTATVDVTMPPPPGNARLGLSVSVDPIPLSIRATCSTAVSPTTGVRSASIIATGPAWARIELANLTQDPAICNPRRISLGFSLTAMSTTVAGLLGLLIGALVF